MRFKRSHLIAVLAIAALAVFLTYPCHAQASKPYAYGLNALQTDRLSVDALTGSEVGGGVQPADRADPVTVYSPLRGYCFYCEQTKRWLQERGVAYREVRTNRFDSFPRVQIGKRLIRGYDTSAFARALGVRDSELQEVQTQVGNEKPVARRVMLSGAPPTAAAAAVRTTYTWHTPYGYTVTRSCGSCR